MTYKRIRNTATPNSEILITTRPNGGVKIQQGPVYILVGPGEVKPVSTAIAEAAQ